MAGRPPPLPSSAGEPFPPLPLSYRAALAAPPPSVCASPAVGTQSGLILMAADAPPLPVPPPSPAGSSLAGARPAAGSSRSFACAPSGRVQPPTGLGRPLASPRRHGPPPGGQASAAAGSPGFLSSALSLPDVMPDVVLLRSQLLASGFPHGPLDMTPPMTVGAHMRDCPPPTTVYSQPFTLTSSLRAPSDDVAAILAATRAAVTAARQQAQDAVRALEQEQAVFDTIERQYAETYHCLAGKGVSDGNPTFARHSVDAFEPAPAPASTLRASLHAHATALTSIRATVTDVLAPDSTQYPRWRDQVLQTLRRYALADHVLSTVTDSMEDWLLVDEVVLSWIHGTLTAELQDIVRVSEDTAHRIWGALEA
jgi:hypothetical protein